MHRSTLGNVNALSISIYELDARRNIKTIVSTPPRHALPIVGREKFPNVADYSTLLPDRRNEESLCPFVPLQSDMSRLKQVSKRRHQPFGVSNSSFIKPCLLVLFQHPLGFAVSSTRLHLDHDLLEIDELGGTSCRAVILACRALLLVRSSAFTPSCLLQIVHNFAQAFVCASVQSLELERWEAGGFAWRGEGFELSGIV